jgi:hypothetical protein
MLVGLVFGGAGFENRGGRITIFGDAPCEQQRGTHKTIS